MPKAQCDDTYRLDRIRSVPFPTRLLELTLSLPETQARIITYIVRATLGWQAGGRHERKASVCLTHRQLREHIGRNSPAALTDNLQALVRRGIVEATRADGQRLPASARLTQWRRPVRLRIARRYVEELAVGDKAGENIY